MTKAQQKALERAEKENFTDKQIKFLRDSSHYAWAYTVGHNYFSYINKNHANNMKLVEESVDMLDHFCTELPNKHMVELYAWTYLKNPECVTYIFFSEYKERIILGEILPYITTDTKLLDILYISEKLKKQLPEEEFETCEWHNLSLSFSVGSECKSINSRDVITIYAKVYGLGFLRDDIPIERIDTFLSELNPEIMCSICGEYMHPYTIANKILKVLQNDISLEEAIQYQWSIKEYKAAQARKNREKLGKFTEAYPEESYENDTPIYYMLNESTLLELQKYGTDIIASYPAYSMKIAYRDYGLLFSFYNYKDIKVETNRIYPKTMTESLMVLLTYDGAFLRKCHKSGKFIPLTVKDLAKFYQPDNMLFERFLKNLEQYYLDYGKPFIKDIMPYIKNKNFFPPTALHELMEYTSFHHIYNKKYPVEKNWNKNDINWLYMLHLVTPYISELDLRRLRNISPQTASRILEQSEITMYSNFARPKQWNSPQKRLLKAILKTHFSENDQSVYSMISDYLNMCFATKEKVRLGFSSIRKLKEEHDRISEKYCSSRTKPVKIPKDSKFSSLSTELGQEFEWIKTKKRLVSEAQTMHHCVWQYADKITADKCAIYHFIYPHDNKPYTVEIICKGNKFQIRQVYGIWDSYSKGADIYVHEKISQINKSAHKKAA